MVLLSRIYSSRKVRRGHASFNVTPFRETAARDRRHRIAAGQTDPAGCLAPERLGFDDLTELPVVRAVVPAICINPHRLVRIPRHKW